MTEPEFIQFIQGETKHARHDVGKWVRARNSQVEIGCVDPLTKHKGAYFNPPGGGIFLLSENVLGKWIEHRSGLSGGIGFHEYCGFMYVILGLTTLGQHQSLIREADDAIRYYNEIYGASFYSVPEHDGGARPFMSNFG